MTVTPRKKFSLSGGKYELLIFGSNIGDGSGRAIDGDGNGQPGGTAHFSLSKKGGTVVAASIELSPLAVDAVLAGYRGRH